MKRHKWIWPSVVALLAGWFGTGCAFNFELTSQRTALENQVMGTYAELEDDLVLVASVRSEGGQRSPMSEKERAAFATQNRKFNEDDIDELKVKGVLGEAADGLLVMLPSGVGNVAATPADVLNLAKILIEEDNRDRQIQWQYTISTNENLTSADTANVRQTFAKLQRENAATGDWIQFEDGRWVQKTSTKKVESKEDLMLENAGE